MSTESTTSELVRVGVLGAGAIGGVHIGAVQALPMLALVARSGGTAGAAPFGVPRMSVEEVVAHRDVDVVAVCTPSATHDALARAAVLAGKHVVVEKPLATGVVAARELLDLAVERGARVFTAVQRRYEPEYAYLRELLGTGACGAPRLIEVRLHWYRDDGYFAASPWRAAGPGGDVTRNQALHSIDLLQWLVGPVASVSAHGSTLGRPMTAQDTVTATLEMRSGALATLSLSTATPPGRAAEVAVYTESGYVALGQGEVLAWELDAPAPPARSSAGAGMCDPAAIGLEGHVRLWTDVAESLRNGQPSRCDGSASLGTLALLDALDEASRSGARVMVAAP